MSNKFGDMLLTTGNKSEMAVGYATLYGDMSGGYSVLKDVYKTDGLRAVALAQRSTVPTARWARRAGSSPSASSPSRPRPSCEPNQKDQDSLPPYEVLDDILEGLIEGEMAVGRDRRRAATTRRRCSASGACWTSPSTSAARRRRA